MGKINLVNSVIFRIFTIQKDKKVIYSNREYCNKTLNFNLKFLTLKSKNNGHFIGAQSF